MTVTQTITAVAKNTYKVLVADETGDSAVIKVDMGGSFMGGNGRIHADFEGTIGTPVVNIGGAPTSDGPFVDLITSLNADGVASFPLYPFLKVRHTRASGGGTLTVHVCAPLTSPIFDQTS